MNRGSSTFISQIFKKLFLSCLTVRSEARGQSLSHRRIKLEIFTVVIYNAVPHLGLLGSN